MHSKLSTKALISWCLFDWANSAFPIIVTTFIFATYFTKTIAKNVIIGTSQWGDMIAVVGVCVALLGPILGSIADYSGRRKPYIALFTGLCISSSFLLWFAQPHHSAALFTLIIAGIGIVSLELANVFYNAMLSSLVSPTMIGRLSGWGWGCGYFGGLISLLICLLLFVNNQIPHLDTSSAEHIRICGPFTSVWFLLFAWPLFCFTPDLKKTDLSLKQCINLGINKLYKTISNIRQYKFIARFLLARLLYIDGLNTLFAFGGIYAAGTFNMSYKEVIIFGIAMNVAAGLGATIMAWADDKIGSKFCIVTSLIMLICAGTGMLLVTNKLLFWLLGMCLSIFVGPLQAASRSLLIHLAPPEKLGELFGLYAFSGKITAFLGPFLLAQLTHLFNSQRIGMSTVIVLMLLGLCLMTTVHTPRKTLV